jgi:hypothetical protein
VALFLQGDGAAERTNCGICFAVSVTRRQYIHFLQHGEGRWSSLIKMYQNRFIFIIAVDCLSFIFDALMKKCDRRAAEIFVQKFMLDRL